MKKVKNKCCNCAKNIPPNDCFCSEVCSAIFNGRSSPTKPDTEEDIIFEADRGDFRPNKRYMEAKKQADDAVQQLHDMHDPKSEGCNCRDLQSGSIIQMNENCECITCGMKYADFDTKFPDGVMSGSDPGEVITEEIKSFIRQEKEKSYEQGKREARNDWFDMAEKEREVARHSAYSEIIEDLEKEFDEKFILIESPLLPSITKEDVELRDAIKLFVRQTWNRGINSGYQSAINEVIEFAEKMFIHKRAYKNTSNITIRRGAYNRALIDLLSKIKEKLNKK